MLHIYYCLGQGQYNYDDEAAVDDNKDQDKDEDDDDINDYVEHDNDDRDQNKVIDAEIRTDNKGIAYENINILSAFDNILKEVHFKAST